MTRPLLLAVAIAAVSAVTPARAVVVINEIAASEPADHEWVELHNTGPDAVDLTGWKFVEDGVNHGLVPFTGGTLLPAGGFAVVAQKAEVVSADHPGITLLIDSAWGSLREDGEVIGLRDAAGAMVEQFTYPAAPDHPLERADATADAAVAGNWREHADRGTPGATNSNATGAAPPSPATAQPPAPADEPAPTPSSAGAAYRAGDVVINEFLPDPTDGGSEWVELYNRGGQLINLEGWRLEDGSEAKTTLHGTLAGFAWTVVSKPTGNLNNRGDRLVLRDAAGEVMDAVSYGDWQDGDTRDNAPTAADGAAVGRRTDGLDTGNDAADFAVLPTPTPGAANRTQAADEPPAAPAGTVRFSELLPNPIGADTEGEFIELVNDATSAVSLDGWQLADAAGGSYTLETIAVSAGGYLTLPRSTSGLALDNTGAETLTLRRPDDSVADTVRYPAPAPEGQAYARGTGSRWAWTLQPTPGAANVAARANQPPRAALDAPPRASVGEILTFDGSDSSDPDRDALVYAWDFGDGRTDAGPLVRQIYATAGRYRVTLEVSDGRGATGTAQASVTVVGTAAPADGLEQSPAPPSQAPTNVQRPAAPAAPTKTSPRTPAPAPRPSAGQRDAVVGTVLVAPGVLGRQYFYLDDGSRGLQVYQFAGDFPLLAPGDRVRASGTWSEVTGTPRLKLAAGSDLTILGGHATPTPQETSSNAAGADLVGRLVTVRGTITQLTGEQFVLDDGAGELAGSLRASAGFGAAPFGVGASVAVTGILDAGRGGLRLLPRSPADVTVSSVLGASTTATSTPINAGNGWTIGLTIAAVAASGLGWWHRRTAGRPTLPTA